MSFNQSRSTDKSDTQYRKTGRSATSKRQRGSSGSFGRGSGGGGPAFSPSITSSSSLSSNRSFRKSHNNAQGGHTRVNNPPGNPADSNHPSVLRGVPNGSYVPSQLHGASDASITTATVRPSEPSAAPSGAQAVQKAPNPQSNTLSSQPAPVSSAQAAPPTSNKGEAAKPVTLQFGSLNASVMNGMQARHESYGAVPSFPIPAVLKQQQPPRNKNQDKDMRKPNTCPKPSVLSLDDGDKGKGYNRFKNMPKLPLMKANALGVWFVDVIELEAKVIGEGKWVEAKNINEWKSVVERKREMGERLMAQYVQDYESSRGQSGDIKMLVSTQRSGTAADKVSAFSLMVGDNPMANLRSLDGLLGMVTSKVGKRHALTGFEALKELFISSLLPDRKLKNLNQKPLNHVPETKDGNSLLLFWYWEECLKQRYERFIVALEEASRDMLPVLKHKAIKIMYVLLKSKSEQERKLLTALVNKLGDPENKASSNADFHLSNLLSEHPNMKAVVIDEVDSFLFRPHLGARSKYHAVNFLSQIRLTHKGDGPKVAKRLIDVYFALFKVLISEAGGDQKTKSSSKVKSEDSPINDSSESHVELDSRLLSALLMGINRAFPYVSSDEADNVIEVQTPMLFQLVHSKNFNVGIQALMLLDKISSKNKIASDRFYRALYSKLLVPAAMNTSKAEMFVGLILRAMKNDINLKRIASFSKRLLQMALQQPPQYACGCLFLLSEVLKVKPPLWKMMLQNECDDEELEHFEDIVENDDDNASNQTKEQTNDVTSVQNSNDAGFSNDSSEDEDNPPSASSESNDSDEGAELLLKDEENLHEQKTDSTRANWKSQMSKFLPGGYDPRHREPSYCNADRVSWWELVVLASHAHPSVATMANTLSSGANIVYNGNPLSDLSLTAFLDKFMEKKPKTNAWHGVTEIEPANKLNIETQRLGPEILSLAEEDVPPEDLVFHKFYANKISSSKKAKKKKKPVDEEDAEELCDMGGGDESDNEEIADMLDSANDFVEAEGDYNYDDLDKVANVDDDELVGNDSDTDLDVISDVDEGEEFDIPGKEFDADIDNNVIDDDDNLNIEVDDIVDDHDIEVEDIGDDADLLDRRKQRQKAGGKSAVSPFASYEAYAHLLNAKQIEEKFGEPKSKSKKRKKSGQSEKHIVQNKREPKKKRKSS